MSTGLNSLYPRLLADVGATHARTALETAPGVLEDVDVRASDAYPSLLDAVRDYLAQAGARGVVHAAIGIATAVTAAITTTVSTTATAFGIDRTDRREIGGQQGRRAECECTGYRNNQGHFDLVIASRGGGLRYLYDLLQPPQFGACRRNASTPVPTPSLPR